MTVRPHGGRDLDADEEEAVDSSGRVTNGQQGQEQQEGVKMRNSWLTAGVAVVIWLIITVMNVANLVLLGKGQGA